MIKKALHIGLWCISLLGMLVLMGFVHQEQGRLKCKKLSININYEDQNLFVVEQDIRNSIKNLGYGVVDQPLYEINLNQIENILNNNSSISRAEVYATIDGELKIEIDQRRPILRVFNTRGHSFYIDEEGKLMPTAENYTSRVIVATGNIVNNITSYYIIRN